MPGITHCIWIDESGNGRRLANGSPDNSVRSLWITAGVAVEWSRRSTIDARVRKILEERFLGRCKELRANSIRRYLPAEQSVDDLASDICKLMTAAEAKVWICGARGGGRPMYTHPKGDKAEAKDIARQLLLERVNGYTSPRYFGTESWLMIWDVGDAGALGDFSSAVTAFRNRISGKGLQPALTPVMLGGLSHEWGPIQLADVFANFALHKVGLALGLPDANPLRAAAFDRHMAPALKRDNAGKPVGWKIW